MDLKLKEEKADLATYVLNGEWHLLGNNLVKYFLANPKNAFRISGVFPAREKVVKSVMAGRFENARQKSSCPPLKKWQIKFLQGGRQENISKTKAA